MGKMSNASAFALSANEGCEDSSVTSGQVVTEVLNFLQQQLSV